MKKAQHIYAACQYPIQHNELLNGKPQKENRKLHIKDD